MVSWRGDVIVKTSLPRRAMPHTYTTARGRRCVPSAGAAVASRHRELRPRPRQLHCSYCTILTLSEQDLQHVGTASRGCRQRVLVKRKWTPCGLSAHACFVVESQTGRRPFQEYETSETTGTLQSEKLLCPPHACRLWTLRAGSVPLVLALAKGMASSVASAREMERWVGRSVRQLSARCPCRFPSSRTSTGPGHGAARNV